MPSSGRTATKSLKSSSTRVTSSETEGQGKDPLPLPLQTATPCKTLKYQFRGPLNLSCCSGVPSRNELEKTHRTMRLGLGTPLNNLKVNHLVNSKKNQTVFIPMRTIKPGCKKTNSGSAKIGTCSPLDFQMKKLTIYESPGNDVKSTANKATVFDTNFKRLNRKANALANGESVSFTLYEKSIKIQNAIDLSQSCEEEEVKAIPNLCRGIRGLFGWNMSLHVRWKYIEERVLKWPSKLTPVTQKEIAGILKIPEDQLQLLQIIPELKEILHVLKNNICHVNSPNIAKILALSELQLGDSNAAARYLSQSQAMFLHGDIVDKHLNYIRRNEELFQTPRTKDEADMESFKTSLFMSQINDTLKFNEDFFKHDGESEFMKKLSSFDPNWNIIQLSTSVHSTNRFSNDLIGRKEVPQIILSAFCNVPGVSSICQFTTFCKEPPVDVGSMMRHGLAEEFQKVLDKNLSISDEWTVITRKKYWEERARHNEAMQIIMFGMEEWLNPWTFLLAGRIKDESIQKLIEVEILSDAHFDTATGSQKLLISRLTENYGKLPITTRIVLDTLIGYILQIDEEAARSVMLKVEDIGSRIFVDAPRHPTILILDQEIDCLPWDWLPCLRNTDVTRMPSLNLINSSKNLRTTLKQDYPVIVEPEKCTFVLNPDGTLPNVQERMEEYLRGRKEWVPIVARSPTTQEMQDTLENQDLLLYCGHGAGSNYYPEHAVQKLVCRAVPLLMGCSSAQSHYTGPRLYANSVINTYFIAGCASMVGFLWEITDTECDRLTVDFLERWLPDPSLKPPKMAFFDTEGKREKDEYLPAALRKSRPAATQFLTQCSVVCYGLPLKTISS